MLTKEQIEQRRFSLGASDAAVVMGLSPWKSALQLWLEKTGAVEAEDLSENGSVEWGNRLESLIIAKFAESHPELEVTPNTEQVSESHKYHPFITATVDAWVVALDASTYPLEIKTASAWKEKEWEQGVPTYYLAQVQHQMFVTGAEKAWVAVLIGGQSYKEYLVLRDDAFISLMLDAERSFWDRVCNVIPPDADGSESAADALKAMYPQSVEDKCIDLPPELENTIALKRVHEKTIDEYEAVERALTQKVISALGDAEQGKVGRYVVSYKSNKKGYRTLRIKEIAEVSA